MKEKPNEKNGIEERELERARESARESAGKKKALGNLNDYNKS